LKTQRISQDVAFAASTKISPTGGNVSLSKEWRHYGQVFVMRCDRRFGGWKSSSASSSPRLTDARADRCHVGFGGIRGFAMLRSLASHHASCLPRTSAFTVNRPKQSAACSFLFFIVYDLLVSWNFSNNLVSFLHYGKNGKKRF